MTVSIIAAMDGRGAIGYKNGIPWDISEERKFFKNTTVDGCVLMGRVTWESLPDKYKPLPRRINSIISPTWYSSGKKYDGQTMVVRDLNHGIDLLQKLHHPKDIWIIGGGRVYQEAVNSPLVNQIVLSKIPGEYPGDTFFPPLDNSWFPTHYELFPRFSVTTYGRRTRTSTDDYRTATEESARSAS